MIGKKEESKELMDLVFKRDREKLSNVLELVNNDDWEILAVWFQSTDLVSHLYPGNKLKHMVVYKFADRAVEMTRMKLPGGTCLVVLSDHGNDWRRGVHKERGFVSISSYGSSWSLPESITEVYSFLRGILEA